MATKERRRRSGDEGAATKERRRRSGDEGAATKERRRRARKFKELTDPEIVVLILAGRWIVDLQTGDVFTNRDREKPLRTRICHRGYKHVALFHEGARREIVVHKMVWMAANQQPVPNGFEVHHGKEGKHCNAVRNLQLREKLEHNWYHVWKASSKVQAAYPHYSDYVAFRRSQNPDTLDDFYADFD